MRKEIIKDYLRFTKKDRVGILVLAALIFLVVLLPYLWPSKKIKQADKQEIEKVKMLAAQLNNKEKDVTAHQGTDEKDDNNRPAYAYSPAKNYNRTKADIFYFDPNTLDAAGWQRLGIREKTATTILKYTSRGGKFLKPEDISKIYGLFKDDYERLLPYVRIANQHEPEKNELSKSKELIPAIKPAYPARQPVALKPIDINNADTAALIALPGIGSKLAARIINFREKLGGFYSVQQVAETYGLPDSTFNKIKPVLECNSPAVQKININMADANTLKQHPYIRWNLANAIVQYRAQHGNFKSPEGLLQMAQVTQDIFDKLRPYLVCE